MVFKLLTNNTTPYATNDNDVAGIARSILATRISSKRPTARPTNPEAFGFREPRE